MSDKGKNILVLLQEFKKDLKKISGHPVSYEDEYYKELYITMLSSIAFANGSVEKIEVKYLMSLQNTFKLEGEIITYLNKAGTIDKERVEEFIEFLNNKNFKYSFLLDSLILISLEGNLNEDKINVVGEFAEVLNIEVEEMEFLCEMAVAILEENTKKLNGLLKNTPKSIHSSYFRPYVMGFVDVFVIEDETLQGINEFTGNLFINDIIIVNGILKIKDAKIKFGSNGKLVCRSGVELFIEDSQFINGEIICEDVNSLSVKNSTFKDCDNKRCISIYNCHNELSVNNCKFENCVLNNKNNGGAITIVDSNVVMKGLYFSNCKVEGCGGALYIKESNEFYETIELENLQFSFCNAQYGGAIYMCGEHNKSFSQYIIVESIFNNCKASKHGGAINIYNKEYYKKIVLKSDFNNCEAILGGGIYSNFGNVENSIINCRFNDCKSENDGTAIFYNEFIRSDESCSWNVISNCNNPYNFE